MIYFFLIAGLVIGLDQITKYIILQYVQEHGLEYREYITSGNNILDLTFATNTGAAFSLFPNQQVLFIIITLITISGILIYLLRSEKLTFLPKFGLGLIFGGAIGNLIDRLIHGKVIDFIDLHWKEIYHWPTFNIADSAICIGVAILFIYMFWIEPRSIKSDNMSLEDTTNMVDHTSHLES